MGFVSTALGWLGIASPQSQPSAYSGLGGGGRAYEAGVFNTNGLADWFPSIASPDDEVLQTREQLVARARDLYRNHAVIHGAVEKIADAIIGNRVMLNAQPAHDLLKRNLEWSINWSLTAQAEFKVWGYGSRFSCDAAQEQTIGQLARTAFIGWFVDGEGLAVLRNRDAGERYTTCVELIDPDRLSTPSGMIDNQKLPNGNTMFAGIEYNDFNAPIAYHFRVAHPSKAAQGTDSFRWVRIERFSPDGRPQVIHTFRRTRANQRRGVSQLASVIKRVRMNDRYDQAELDAALFDAINAGVVQSGYPPAEVAQAFAPDGGAESSDAWSFQGQMAYRAKNGVKMQGVRMVQTLPGEQIHWKQPARPAANYPAFKGAGQHDMAAGVGLSYPQISEDWADINYSSARTLLNEKWRGFDTITTEFCSQFMTPIYQALLFEMVAIGTVKVPGGAGRFSEVRGLLGYASWLTPGRGTIDPMKEEQAADIAINGGRSTSALECARNGIDHYEVLLGQAEDKILRKKLGLEEFMPLKIAGAAGAQEDQGGDSKGSADDRDGDGQPNEDQKRDKKRPAA
jgi:lambda family phage portal protein